MQEFARNFYDALLDHQESEPAEQTVHVPQIFTIPKGTLHYKIS